jgi:3-dehydroquinate synthetase
MNMLESLQSLVIDIIDEMIKATVNKDFETFARLKKQLDYLRQTINTQEIIASCYNN